MVKFDEQKQIDSVNGALALRPQIEELIDRLLAEGVKNLCWLGIGGTWASGMQVVCYLKEHTDMDTFATNAAEYCTTGDKRVGAGNPCGPLLCDRYHHGDRGCGSSGPEPRRKGAGVH